MIRKSKIDLSLYITPADLKLLRDKKGRSTRNGKFNIIKRSLELVREAKKGNIESRNYLFLLHTPYMRWKLNQWFCIHPSKFDEYMSDCFLYFQSAVDVFDETKSDNFIFILGRVLKQNFINDYNYQKLHKLDIANYSDCEEDSEYEDKYFVDYDVKIFEIQNAE